MAYSAGATGKGIKIAVVDSGLTDALGKFTGRIDSASRDMAGTRGIADGSGHGTAVTAVAAAGRTASQIHGLAFDSSLLVLRTDTPGSCATACEHMNSVLADAVDHARTNGARVINMSLGGSAMDADLVDAIDRATAAGIIVVVSAGNGGTAQPDAFASVAGNAKARGLVVVAGSHDVHGNLANFSAKAGSLSQYYIAALGEDVRSFDQNGDGWLYSGTSFSAAAVSGAVALLAQAFPTLTGEQIVDLLMTTATDRGTIGADAVYGQGLMDLTRAFQPQGALALAGSRSAISLTDNAVLSPAMGDAAPGIRGSAILLDGYARAYSVNLDGTVRRTAVSRPLMNMVGRRTGRSVMDLGMAALAVRFTDPAAAGTGSSRVWLGEDRSRLSNQPGARPQALSGSLSLALDGQTTALASFGEPIASTSAPQAAWLVAQDVSAVPGFEANRGTSLGVARHMGAISLLATAESGTARKIRADDADRGYNLVHLAGERSWNALRVRVGLGLMREEDTVLGARFSPGLGGGGASTMLADMDVGLALGGAWTARAQWRQGWTRADQGGAVIEGRLVSNAFAVDLVREGRTDRLAFRVSQPLRVEKGAYRLNLPVSYDYADQRIGYGAANMNLAPTGREIDLEVSYARAVGGGWLDTNIFARRQPGNVAAAYDDIGGALRYRVAF